MPNPIKGFRNAKKIPQVSNEGLVSKPLNISSVMDNSWDTQELPLRKPFWLLENNHYPQVIVKCTIDILFITFAENWKKRHWFIIID